jgi:hypothetical protein
MRLKNAILGLLSICSTASLIACSEQKKLTEMHDATIRMDNTTLEMNENTKSMKTKTNEMSVQTRKMSDTTDDMAKTTKDMAKTTEEMRKTTDRMAGTTDHMAKTTDQMLDVTQGLAQQTQELKLDTEELYDALRQGSSLQVRELLLKALVEAPNMIAKASKAGKYFMSFEFQLWTNRSQDKSEQKRDLLIQQAIEELFIEIKGLVNSVYQETEIKTVPSSNKNSGVFDVTNRENLIASFNALAASAHKINRKQIENISLYSKKLTPYSVLDIIKLALKYEKSSEAERAKISENRKEAYKIVLENRERAILLLQTRYSFLPLSVMNSFSDFSDQNFIQKIVSTKFSWTLDLSHTANAERLEYYHSNVLKMALEDRDFLLSIGETPKLHMVTLGLLKNMKIENIPSDSDVSVLAKEKREIAKVFNELLSKAQ